MPPGHVPSAIGAVLGVVHTKIAPPMQAASSATRSTGALQPTTRSRKPLEGLTNIILLSANHALDLPRSWSERYPQAPSSRSPTPARRFSKPASPASTDRPRRRCYRPRLSRSSPRRTQPVRRARPASKRTTIFNGLHYPRSRAASSPPLRLRPGERSDILISPPPSPAPWRARTSRPTPVSSTGSSSRNARRSPRAAR